MMSSKNEAMARSCARQAAPGQVGDDAARSAVPARCPVQPLRAPGACQAMAASAAGSHTSSRDVIAHYPHPINTVSVDSTGEFAALGGCGAPASR